LKEIGQKSFGLGGPTHIGGEARGELGLRVGAGDAEGVDEGLVFARVLDELAGELGLFDGRVRGDGGALGDERPLEALGLCELTFDARSIRVFALQSREGAAGVALAAARDDDGALEASARRIGDDGGGVVRLGLPSVELVASPALGAVLEAVFLVSAAAGRTVEKRGV